jgi:hypothetical protein
MKKVSRNEILDIAAYENVRDQRRRTIIELKRLRRVAVGPLISFVFENHQTALFQIQEMMRAERIVDEEAIQHEIDTYNDLLPFEGQLAATMMIEVTDPTHVRTVLNTLYGINTGGSTYLRIGHGRVPGEFAAGQEDGQRLSAVQYVRFHPDQDQLAIFASGPEEISLVIDHPHYQHETVLTPEVRRELSRDLEATTEP